MKLSSRAIRIVRSLYLGVLVSAAALAIWGIVASARSYTVEPAWQTARRAASALAVLFVVIAFTAVLLQRGFRAIALPTLVASLLLVYLTVDFFISGYVKGWPAATRGEAARANAVAASLTLIVLVLVVLAVRVSIPRTPPIVSAATAFMFFDELRSAGDGPLSVLARIRVLATEEGGRKTPFTTHYRPNHNFGSSENRHFFIGQIEVPAGEWVRPGETRELIVKFLNVQGLAQNLVVGRKWRIQEGPHLVAEAEVLSLLGDPDENRIHSRSIV